MLELPEHISLSDYAKHSVIEFLNIYLCMNYSMYLWRNAHEWLMNKNVFVLGTSKRWDGKLSAHFQA